MSTADEAAPPRVLGDIPRLQARLRPEEIAIHFEGRNTSFAEFDRNTNRVANALREAGIGQAKRIGYLGHNADAYLEALLGAARCGAVMVPINWRLATPEIGYILADAECELLFVGREFEPVAAQLRGELPALKTIIGIDGPVAGQACFSDWRDASSDTDPGLAIDPGSVAVQMYTSGTTGHPKGVQLSHAGFFALEAAAPQDWDRWQTGEVSMMAMPAFHIAGTRSAVRSLRNGAQTLVLREFAPGPVLEAIERFRISKVLMVPAALKQVMDHPRAGKTDFSSLRYITYGASPIPLDLLRRAIDVFGCHLVQLYGMTETTGTVAYLPAEDHDAAGNERMTSAGIPLPGVRIRVLDERGAELGPRRVGEICVQSPTNMLGYWKLPDATATTLRSGWLHTGDAGFIDEDGYVYIRDRLKDMIVSGGENVYPAEVESVLYGHPDVLDVAVIGVPDDRWGEAVKAVIVRKDGSDPDANDILAFARDRIASYKLPKSIDFVDALPRNPSGKLLKRELREPYWKGRERRVN